MAWKEKTAADRAIEEPKRATGSGHDVWSNYYFCPALCRNCGYFYKKDSNWPYHCTVGISDAPSNRSKRDGYKQYDDCRYFKEKIEQKVSSMYDDEINRKKDAAMSDIEDARQKLEDERKEWEYEREQQLREEREEAEYRKQQEQQEFENRHCFYCAKQGFLLQFHSKKFHEECLSKFKQSPDSKKWIEEEEAVENAIRENEERRRKKLILKEEMARREAEEEKEKEKQHQEWLKTTEGQKWQAEERERELLEEKNRNKQRLMEKISSINSIIIRLATIFITIGYFVIFFHRDSWMKFLTRTSIIGVGVGAYLTYMYIKIINHILKIINEGFNEAINDELAKKSNKKLNGLHWISTHLILCLLIVAIISAAYYGIWFLGMHFLLKIW